jgi:thiamine phosphate synthase YjbQ (UPF0047 family)
LRIKGRKMLVTMPHGRLGLGRWEQIFHTGFDGWRRKRVLVKTIGE